MPSCMTRFGQIVDQARISNSLDRGVLASLDGGTGTLDEGLPVVLLDNGASVAAGDVVWFIREGRASVVLGRQVE